MTEMKPCPFCGGEAELFKIPVPPYPDKYYVRCHSRNICRVSVHTFMGGTAEEAVEDWNRRAAFTTAHSEWISVTEQLPESINEYVLCCGEKGGQFVGWIAEGMIESGKARAFQHGGRGRNITHWMPLPEPPKEET